MKNDKKKSETGERIPTPPTNIIAGFYLSISLAVLASQVGGFGFTDFISYKGLFILFFILFRTKMYLDDIRLAIELNTFRDLVNLLIGIFLWFCWIVSARNISCLNLALEWVLYFFVIATIQLATVSNDHKYRKLWIIFNVFYMIFIIPFIISPSGFFLIFIIIVCLIDIYISWKIGIIEKSRQVEES